MQKTCFRCLEIKPISEFYVHSKMSDGVIGKCKICTRIQTKERGDRLKLDPVWREKELDRQRKKSKRHREEGRKQNKESSDAAKRRWAQNNPHKVRARSAVNNAIQSGVITKMPCSVCGSHQSEGHHEDYSKPLDVIWYCSKHHAERHVEIRRMKRLKNISDATF
jgi:hypothetical protein